MNYETMVKEAYEEIMGFDKEAAGYAEGVATLGKKINGADRQRIMNNVAESQAARQAHTYANPKNVFDHAAGGLNKATNSLGNTASKLGDKLTNFKPTGKQVAVGGGIAAGTIVAGLTAKKLYDRHKQKQAEKAAAYYDEAQYIKEAAEADYAEACAYEDAALAILDELGYLD